MAKKETYVSARARLLAELSSQGWKTEPHLKEPRADSPDGEISLWFTPQSVYMATGSRSYRAQRAGAHSLWIDTRGLPVSKLLDDVTYRLKQTRHDQTR